MAGQNEEEMRDFGAGRQRELYSVLGLWNAFKKAPPSRIPQARGPKTPDCHSRLHPRTLKGDSLSSPAQVSGPTPRPEDISLLSPAATLTALPCPARRVLCLVPPLLSVKAVHLGGKEACFIPGASG